MNDDIETLLSQMPLRKPPASLDARIKALHDQACETHVAPPPSAEHLVLAESTAAGTAPPRAAVPHGLSGSHTRSGSRRAWVLEILGGSLAAAAAVMLAWGLWPAEVPVAPAPAGEAVAKAADPAGPIRVEQNWSEVSYDGLVFPDEQTPMQKFRRQTLEHVQWIDAKNGVRMETTRPREDIILLSAPLQ